MRSTGAITVMGGTVTLIAKRGTVTITTMRGTVALFAMVGTVVREEREGGETEKRELERER